MKAQGRKRVPRGILLVSTDDICVKKSGPNSGKLLLSFTRWLSHLLASNLGNTRVFSEKIRA